MAMIPDGEWQLECSAAVFDRLRTDREFAFLTTLARVLNATKFGVEAHRTYAEELTPIGERHRVGALLYLAAVVHEILELKKKAETDYSDLPAVSTVFSVFSEDRLDAELVTVLHRIRNRAAFHFDVAAAERALPRLPAEPFTFVAAVGRDPMTANYELADIVTFGFLFDAYADVDQLSARLKAFRPKLDRLLLDFVKAADQYLFKRLRELGFVVAPRPEGSFAMDREDQSSDPPRSV
jgi:hypothetical protein